MIVLIICETQANVEDISLRQIVFPKTDYFFKLMLALIRKVMRMAYITIDTT